MKQFLFAVILLGLVPGVSIADQGYPYPDMQVIKTEKTFKDLIADFRDAVKMNEMLLVTQACGSCGAKNLGFDILGNYVGGVFRNDFARAAFAVHVPAGIEFPIRYYITENDDKTATLTYRKPSTMLASYGVAALDPIGADLDKVFAAIAEDSVR